MQSCRVCARPGWLGRSVYLILLFAFVVNVLAPASPQTAFAGLTIEDVSKRDQDSEITDASKDAKKRLEGASSGIRGIFNDVRNFFVGTYTDFDNWMNNLFGFEHGEGTQAYFGTLIYAFLFMVFLFVGKFIYNIFAGLFEYKGSRSRVPERYRKQ